DVLDREDGSAAQAVARWRGGVSRKGDLTNQRRGPTDCCAQKKIVGGGSMLQNLSAFRADTLGRGLCRLLQDRPEIVTRKGPCAESRDDRQPVRVAQGRAGSRGYPNRVAVPRRCRRRVLLRPPWRHPERPARAYLAASRR